MPRVVDLTRTIDAALPGVEIRVAKTIEREGWNATTLSLYSHCGTHMDAPRHFLPGGETIDRQALEVCVGPARVIHLEPSRPRQLLVPGDLGSAADEIAAGARLLLRTDWHRRHGTPSFRDELPRLSLELVDWLVARRVALVGVEPPSVADVNNREELTAVHQALFRGCVVIVEGLVGLDALRTDHVEFIALPLKVRDGDGTPVRAIAIEP